MMTPALRRFTFTTHVTSSVGWVGAVMAFLALALIGFTSDDEVKVRGAYLLMAPAAWFVLVPLAHASLLSGIVLSLGTTWGLFRHYWVVLKLGITVFATVILLMYMRTFSQMAGVAEDPLLELEVVRNASPIVHAMLALILLLAATVLGVYKPFGLTAFGRRKQKEQHAEVPPSIPSPRTMRQNIETSGTPRSLYVYGILALVVFLLFLVMHLTGAIMIRH
jgi:hypothetical protein